MREYFVYNLIEQLNLKGIILPGIGLLNPIPAKAGIALSISPELSTDIIGSREAEIFLTIFHPIKSYCVDTSYKQVSKYQNSLLSRDSGVMLCPFGGATGRIHPL